jgi:hypothetical protein
MNTVFSSLRLCVCVSGVSCKCFLIAGRPHLEGVEPSGDELQALGVEDGGGQHGGHGEQCGDLARGPACIHRFDHFTHGICSLLLKDIAARRSSI